MKQAFYIAVLPLLIAAAALTSVLLQAESKPRILCLGDSSLFASVQLNTGFPVDLQQLLGSRAVVLHGGAAGNDVLSMIGMYHLNYESQPADIVVIRVGWNDQFRMDWPLDVFGPRLTKFVRELQAKGVRVLIVNWEAPAIVNGVKWGEAPQAVILERNAAVNAHLAQVCKMTGATLVGPGLLKSDFDAGDPVHPNAAGSRRIADALYAKILPLI